MFSPVHLNSASGASFPSRRLARPAAIAALAGALLTLAAPASARECVNGYRIIGDNTLVRCEQVVGQSAPAAAIPQPRPSQSEPLYTGSISRRASTAMVVEQNECRPGLYHMMEWGTNGGSVLLRC